MLLFHVSDEPDLDRWQSGIFYADDTPKASFEIVRDAVSELRAATAPATDGIAPASLPCPAAARGPTTRVGNRSGR
jgi:hypothetical protein